MKPRSAKAKGRLLERDVANVLRVAGAKARTQPGSGIYRDFPADVWCEIPGLGPVLIECKCHARPLATVRRWLGRATVLVHKANCEPALVTIPLTHYAELIAHICSYNAEPTKGAAA